MHFCEFLSIRIRVECWPWPHITVIDHSLIGQLGIFLSFISLDASFQMILDFQRI